MAKVKAELHFYDVKNCGLYLGRSDEARCLTLSSLMKDLRAWGLEKDKPLVETSTFNSNKSYKPSYLFGMSEHSGQFLLSLWNAVPQSSKGIGKVDGASKPGKLKVSHAKIGASDIPGYATFFWILPSSNQVVAVKLENPTFGVVQFREYIKGFLGNFSSYIVNRVVDGEVLTGYSDKPKKTAGPDDRVPIPKLKPRFSFSARKIPGKQDEILAKSTRVSKLVRDIYVYNNLKDQNSGILERLSEMFNSLEPKNKRKVRVSMPVELNRDDVKELIDLYNENDQSEIYDVGFVFSGESGHIEWLSGSNKKEVVSLNVKWISDDQPDLDSLLKSLQSHMDVFDDLEHDGNYSEKAG